MQQTKYSFPLPHLGDYRKDELLESARCVFKCFIIVTFLYALKENHPLLDMTRCFVAVLALISHISDSVTGSTTAMQLENRTQNTNTCCCVMGEGVLI